MAEPFVVSGDSAREQRERRERLAQRDREEKLTMAPARPRTVTTDDHRVVAFTPPTPSGWQFMARELDEMANQIRKGKSLTTDDALDLENIAVILRLHGRSC